MIRNVSFDDARLLCEIYNHYVQETTVTFEEAPVSTAEMETRIRESLEGNLPWLVSTEEDKLLGYAMTSTWKSRCAYRYSLESTVYLKPDQTGKGLGSSLYSALIEQIRGLNYHTIIAGIAQPNDASVRLHEKFGFEKIGHFREIGYKFDRWIDVGYWELVL